MNVTEQQEMFFGINSTMFAKLAMRWPAVKWIRKLLEANPEADKWMIEILREFVKNEDAFRGKREWPILHIIRASGEKKLAAIVDELIAIHNRHHKEWDLVLVDVTLVALGEMGPLAFDSVLKAFTDAKEDDVKTTYLGILCRIGVQDARVRDALLACYDIEPPYLAGSIAEYGDKTLLPFLYEKIEAVVPVLRTQIPTTRFESPELNLYIELREAIVNLEKGNFFKNISFSLVDFYRRKGETSGEFEMKLVEEFARYKGFANELDRRFFNCDAKLFRDDDELDDEDYNDESAFGNETTFKRDAPKIGRNDPCSCGSGKKFKKCCLLNLH